MTTTIKLYVSHILMRATESSCARVKSTFTAYLPDPEDFYATYKSGCRIAPVAFSSVFWCRSDRLERRASVIDFVFEYFESFELFDLRVTCLLADSAETSQRIMAPLLESEYKTVILNESACLRLHGSPKSSLRVLMNKRYMFFL